MLHGVTFMNKKGNSEYSNGKKHEHNTDGCYGMKNKTVNGHDVSVNSKLHAY